MSAGTEIQDHCFPVHRGHWHIGISTEHNLVQQGRMKVSIHGLYG